MNFVFRFWHTQKVPFVTMVYGTKVPFISSGRESKVFLPEAVVSSWVGVAEVSPNRCAATSILLFNTTHMMHSALSQPATTIRVVAADRTPMDSQLLAEALSQNPDIEICGAYSASKSALAAMDKERPHVVVLSSKLEDVESKGFEVARTLKSIQPGIRVVMLLDASEPAKVVEAFRSGAKGVFCRSQSLQSLVKCIQSVHVGQVWANSKELAFLLEALAQTPIWDLPAHSSAKLSKREKDVVRAVAEGRTNREIGKHLGLTEHTVKNYLFRIFDKVGVSTRVELVVYALAFGEPGSATSLPPKKAGPSAVPFPVRDESTLERSRSR